MLIPRAVGGDHPLIIVRPSTVIAVLRRNATKGATVATQLPSSSLVTQHRRRGAVLGNQWLWYLGLGSPSGTSMDAVEVSGQVLIIFDDVCLQWRRELDDFQAMTSSYRYLGYILS